jgi:hypothetical protein
VKREQASPIPSLSTPEPYTHPSRRLELDDAPGGLAAREDEERDGRELATGGGEVSTWKSSW